MRNELAGIAIVVLLALARQGRSEFAGRVWSAAILFVLIAAAALCERTGLETAGVITALIAVFMILLAGRAARAATPALGARVRLMAVLVVLIGAVLVFRQHKIWPGGTAAADATLYQLITAGVVFVIFGIVFHRSNL